MVKYFVRKKYQKTVGELINFSKIDFGYPHITILKDEEVLKLINLNVINKYCYKIPYTFKVGDYVTCANEITFDLSDWNISSNHNFEYDNKYLGWVRGKTFKIERLGAGGATMFFHNGDGVYLNWVRPATKEEIENTKR